MEYEGYLGIDGIPLLLEFDGVQACVALGVEGLD
jgi:hypothetical protein